MKALALAVLFAPYWPPPPLDVAKGLPSLKEAKAQIEFGESVRDGYTGGPVYDMVNWNLWFWRQVVLIRDTELDASHRRQHLRELIDWLGWEAVLTGRIPPAVPLELIPIR